MVPAATGGDRTQLKVWWRGLPQAQRDHLAHLLAGDVLPTYLAETLVAAGCPCPWALVHRGLRVERHRVMSAQACEAIQSLASHSMVTAPARVANANT